VKRPSQQQQPRMDCPPRLALTFSPPGADPRRPSTSSASSVETSRSGAPAVSKTARRSAWRAPCAWATGPSSSPPPAPLSAPTTRRHRRRRRTDPPFQASRTPTQGLLPIAVDRRDLPQHLAVLGVPPYIVKTADQIHRLLRPKSRPRSHLPPAPFLNHQDLADRIASFNR